MPPCVTSTMIDFAFGGSIEGLGASSAAGISPPRATHDDASAARPALSAVRREIWKGGFADMRLLLFERSGTRIDTNQHESPRIQCKKDSWKFVSIRVDSCSSSIDIDELVQVQDH